MVNALDGTETAFLVSFPNLAAGSAITVSTSRLWGAEANLMCNVTGIDRCSIDTLVGFRYLDLKEVHADHNVLRPLDVGTFTFQGAPVGIGSLLLDNSRFDARNQFYGGQIGGRLEWDLDPINVGLRSTVALGGTRQVVTTAVTSSLVTAEGSTTVPGGIYAVASNLGRRSSDTFSVVPEVGIDLGWQVTSWASLRVGYSFLYWSSVVRPGEQIDRVVNHRLVPTDVEFGMLGGPARPAPLFNRTEFWAQGVSFVAECRF